MGLLSFSWVCETMKVAVVRETFPGEKRVALLPANIAQLAKRQIQVVVEAGAGVAAGFSDAEYDEAGAEIAADRASLADAEVIVQVRSLGANQEQGRNDLPHFRSGQIVIGMSDPLSSAEVLAELAETGVTHFALELIPRITRAQSMDVLSSMATIAGYRAVLMGSLELPKMFPLMMTAAGTLTAARVFVIGAGVAGLQAIATARRLGAVVHAYDLRPQVREQVESLGVKFVEMELETDDAEGQGGYAKQMDEAFYQRQRELMASVVAESDVVVTTAAIPGRPSPLLVTADAVKNMRPGSVIVDLAAERGGNCELTVADERVEQHGVILYGPTNLPSEVPTHASQMFGNNVTNFLLNLIKEGEVQMDFDDEIIHDTLAVHDGQVFNARLRDMLGLEPLFANIDESDSNANASAESDDTQKEEPSTEEESATDNSAENTGSNGDSAAAGEEPDSDEDQPSDKEKSTEESAE